MEKNPTKLYWERRYAKLSPEKIEALQALSAKGELTDELLVIQRKRPKLRVGDVFILQPKENTYFYGIIIYICSTPFAKFQETVCIFKTVTHEKNMDAFKLNFHNLLLPPFATLRSSWTQGYFYNVGHIDLESEDIPSCGFYHYPTDQLISLDKKQLIFSNKPSTSDMPELVGRTGIWPYGAVARDITRELIINPNLLNEDNPPSQSDFVIEFPKILHEFFGW